MHRVGFIVLVFIPLLSFSQKLKPKVVARLPAEFVESSGLARADSDLLWTMNDDGRAAALYLINLRGENIFAFTDSILHNHDWEDLTEDSLHFLIGDFGNNNQRRTDLVIYIIDRHGKELTLPIEKIIFRYSDQKQFPPPPSNWNFDCEAFFHHGDSLYLFSKNISNPNDGYTKIYRLPDQAGNYTAELIDSFYLNEPVTSADISPDGKTVVLLTYFSLWVFKDFPSNNFFAGKVFQFPLKGLTQKEAICFENNHQLFMTDERHHGRGGRLYSIDLKTLDFSQPTKKLNSSWSKKAVYNFFNNPKVKYRKIIKREAVQ